MFELLVDALDVGQFVLVFEVFAVQRNLFQQVVHDVDRLFLVVANLTNVLVHRNLVVIVCFRGLFGNGVVMVHVDASLTLW